VGAAGGGRECDRTNGRLKKGEKMRWESLQECQMLITPDSRHYYFRTEASQSAGLSRST
jgi:hypothetical protein